MNQVSDDIQDKLALLKQSYRDQLPAKIDEIKVAAVLPGAGDVSDIRLYLETLGRLAHKLAGSGATFGFPDISSTARNLEHACDSALNDQSLSFSGAEEATSSFLVSLMGAVEEALVDGTLDAGIDEFPEPEENAEKILLFISNNKEDAGRLTEEVENSGFAVSHLKHGIELECAINDRNPSAIVFDVSNGENDEAELLKIDQIRKQGAFDGPLVVMSDSGDFRFRLLAVRVKADGYIPKPFLTSDLIDVIDQHLIPAGADDFRILIVDDDQSTARFTEVILQGAGMIVTSLSEPERILDVLDDFGPELILMDLYMPVCNGQELAEVVRQQEIFAAIPIVFLSGEVNIEKQLTAMRSGGDDFLTKPIKPHHLISSIRTRGRRFRMLRSRMVRDSMTGLLNHTATHEFLDNEIARAYRNTTTLSVVAIDIDHFKSVNDTYGHAVGDQVIKSLSRLLRQRLRSNDVIGRMGGEEFAAVLSETGIDRAEDVFNGIRQAFSEIEFPSGDRKFSVTISCGISQYPVHTSSAGLLEAADRALYEAKNTGRNKVVLDSAE